MTGLNEGQKAAADGFFNFLMSTDHEMIISGAGGTGKTFLMGHLINEIMPRYLKICDMMGIPAEYDSVIMTATTNKAAEVLAVETGRPTETIHSFLRLTVKEDWNTGHTTLKKTDRWTVHKRMIIFIDECPMIDSDLHQMIQEGTHGCKIVYVGDSYQLGPVAAGNPVSPIYRANLPYFELTEPMRNSGQAALVNLCNQLRETIRTGAFGPIQLFPGVIDYATPEQMGDLLHEHLVTKQTNARILAFTNSRVSEYNNYIRGEKKLPLHFTVGEQLINNNVVSLGAGRHKLFTEQELKIISMASQSHEFELYDKSSINVIPATVMTSLGALHYNVPIPEDPMHYLELMKYYSKEKKWPIYFQLRESIPDLRPRDASTIHKSQGSSFDTVFLDVGNLSTCNISHMVARLFYVGVSRARQRVVLYGNLSRKYGTIVS